MQGMRGIQGVLGIPDPIHEPMFSTAERDRRWQVLRELMSAEGVETLIGLPAWFDSDAMYMADNVGVVILPLEGDPILLVGGESSNIAVDVPQWIDDRLSVTESGSNAAPFGESTAALLRERGLTGRRTAIAGLRGGMFSSVRQPEGYASYTTVTLIAEAVGAEHIVNGTDIVGRARYVKSEEEIARIAATVRIGEKSLEAMAASARIGVPQRDVYGQMMAAQSSAGADRLHAAWCPGEWGARRHRYVGPPPGDLAEGTYVGTELMPEIRGYQGQVAQALVAGTPNARAMEIFERNCAAFDAGLAALKPGNRFADVFAAVESAIGDAEGSMFTLLHGRGLGDDGPLVVPTSPGDPREGVAEQPILANTTFILKPFMGVPEAPAAYARTHDVTWGDTVVARETGGERLGTRPQSLIIAGS